MICLVQRRQNDFLISMEFGGKKPEWRGSGFDKYLPVGLIRSLSGRQKFIGVMMVGCDRVEVVSDWLFVAQTFHQGKVVCLSGQAWL